MKKNNFTNKIQTTVSLFFVIVVGAGCHGNETGMGGSNREVIIGSSTVSIGDGYFNKDETKGMDEKFLQLHPQKRPPTSLSGNA